MPWKTMDLQQQRVEFVVAASRKEKPFLELCKEFAISRPTGYLWVDRYREQGLGGIAERSRRPRQSPQRTQAEHEQQVIELRRRYPDWGARKLQWRLAQQGCRLAISTVHRILLRHGLVRWQDRHAAAVRRFTRERPNQLWQMDYKSPIGWDSHVGPLAVLDDHSRYLTVLAATGSTRAELVREQLEDAFGHCGVPEEMLMDHGTPWWNTQSPGGITKLAVWLMKQGIGLRWSGVRHPQTQGKVERFHGCLERAMRLRGLPGEGRQAWLDGYRQEYNQSRPHEALGMKPQPACGPRARVSTIHSLRPGSIRRVPNWYECEPKGSCGCRARSIRCRPWLENGYSCCASKSECWSITAIRWCAKSIWKAITP